MNVYKAPHPDSAHPPFYPHKGLFPVIGRIMFSGVCKQIAKSHPARLGILYLKYHCIYIVVTHGLYWSLSHTNSHSLIFFSSKTKPTGFYTRVTTMGTSGQTPNSDLQPHHQTCNLLVQYYRTYASLHLQQCEYLESFQYKLLFR